MVHLFLDWAIRTMAVAVESRSARPSTPVKVDANAAKSVKHLLDVISVSERVAAGLAEFRAKRKDVLTKGDVDDLSVMIDALKCVHQEGRYQAAKVSPVVVRIKADEEKEPARKNKKVSDSMWKVKQFVKRCKNGELRSGEMPSTAKLPVAPPKKKHRQSERLAAVTPDKEKKDARIATLMKGVPPNGDDRWTKDTLKQKCNIM